MVLHSSLKAQTHTRPSCIKLEHTTWGEVHPLDLESEWGTRGILYREEQATIEQSTKRHPWTWYNTKFQEATRNHHNGEHCKRQRREVEVVVLPKATTKNVSLPQHVECNEMKPSSTAM
eukprot:TRINITY_DN62616_c0_g1_i1.p3 TRINITY_DN62616_c0_g1~~TRINITY_DN62616_c0_g1_i1.p3  ORF type:complete len:119 (-),score=14.09 TRINITY_DN62616_c0_g1_i1:48-404(-)